MVVVVEVTDVMVVMVVVEVVMEGRGQSRGHGHGGYQGGHSETFVNLEVWKVWKQLTQQIQAIIKVKHLRSIAR